MGNFSVDKYLGKWYEYAKYPVYFEADGKCITAQYSLQNNSVVGVKNSLVNEKSVAFKIIVNIKIELLKILFTAPISLPISWAMLL